MRFSAIKGVEDKIKGLRLYQINEKGSKVELEGAVDLRQQLESASNGALEEDVAVGQARDSLIYIYTSGTTGLPKAAVITNIRYDLKTSFFPQTKHVLLLI